MTRHKNSTAPVANHHFSHLNCLSYNNSVIFYHHYHRYQHHQNLSLLSSLSYVFFSFFTRLQYKYIHMYYVWLCFVSNISNHHPTCEGGGEGEGIASSKEAYRESWPILPVRHKGWVQPSLHWHQQLGSCCNPRKNKLL